MTQVRNEVLEPALKAVIAELDQMANEPVAAAELTNVKNYIAGMYLLRLETQDGVANQLNTMKTLGLPNDYLETYVTRVRSVEPDQIQAAAKKYIAPEQAAIVVVGDASKIGEVRRNRRDRRRLVENRRGAEEVWRREGRQTAVATASSSPEAARRGTGHRRPRRGPRRRRPEARRGRLGPAAEMFGALLPPGVAYFESRYPPGLLAYFESRKPPLLA